MLRALGFFLLPLYTRFLTPAEYGIVAVAATVTAVLGLLYPLGLHGAVTKFYFSAPDLTTRRRTNGSAWVTMVVFSLAVTLVIDRFGASLFTTLLPQVPFAPYGRLAIWTAFFNVFSLVPLTLLQAEERPGPYVAASGAVTVLTAGAVVYAVVVRHLGAAGYLGATCGAAAIAAGPFVFATLKKVSIAWSWKLVRPALLFALPLVPHGLAGWVLDLSDRVLLERYVAASDVGLYSLGYQFGAIMYTVGAAINTAWVPFIFRLVEDTTRDARADIARLATVYTFVLTGCAVSLALLAPDVIRYFTAPAFHAAEGITPWIVGGYLAACLYFIPSTFLFVFSRTAYIPLVTIAAGIINVALNIWLLPRFGVIAAAWTTLTSYVALVIITWIIGQRVYRVAYEYGRLARIGGCGVAAFALSTLLASRYGFAVVFHVGGIVAFLVFVFSLGGLNVSERAYVVRTARACVGAARRTVRV